MTRAELDQIWYTVIFALKGEFHQRGWLPPALTTASDADERAKELATLRGEPVAFINRRLEDLAEANAIYGKDHRLGAPDKIARNDREISWLKDLRSVIATPDWKQDRAEAPQPVTKASHDPLSR